jgi:hypothetical protein
MAVSFASNSFQLANWGFSVGDIAALSGAGRAVITWLTAAHRDRGLLDFLNTSTSDIGLRRGLVSPEALNQRWGRELSLLHNGRRRDYRSNNPDERVENLDRFTWLMTLIVVCLDQAVYPDAVQEIVTETTLLIFSDKILETEYLRHEIPKHIEGWRSITHVRKLHPRASTFWRSLERDGRHLPGFVPRSDSEELIRLLAWISVGISSEYRTNSSDAFSLAMMLQEMGLDILRTGTVDDHFDESFIVVIYDTSILPPTSRPNSENNRSGMRIPLLALQETVSLWPGSVDDNNRRREVFMLGERAATDLDFAVRADASNEIWDEPQQWLLAFTMDKTPPKRVNPEVFSLARQYLFLPTQAALDALLEFLETWKPLTGSDILKILKSWSLSKDTIPSELLGEWAKQVPRQPTLFSSGLPLGHILSLDSWKMVAEMQIFLLGYYYTALGRLVDVSQLTVMEAFGAWGWYDTSTIGELRKVGETGKEYVDKVHGKGKEYKKESILQLVAKFYAGSNAAQASLIRKDTVGVIGKLTVVTPGLLGDADNPERIRKFILLDIDSTCIPSNSAGLIVAAGRLAPEHLQVRLASATSAISAEDIPQLISSDQVSDFTSHIEPAWDYDPTLCRVVYRHQGRLVSKTNPLMCEAQNLRNSAVCSIFHYGPDQWTFLWGHGCSSNCQVNEIASPCSSGGILEEDSETAMLPEFHSMGKDWLDLQCYQAKLEDFYDAKYIWCNEAGDSADFDYLNPHQPPTTPHECVIVFVRTQGKSKARSCIGSLYTCYMPVEHSRCIREYPWRKYSANPVVIQNQEKGVLVLM